MLIVVIPLVSTCSAFLLEGAKNDVVVEQSFPNVRSLCSPFASESVDGGFCCLFFIQEKFRVFTRFRGRAVVKLKFPEKDRKYPMVVRTQLVAMAGFQFQLVLHFLQLLSISKPASWFDRQVKYALVIRDE